MDTKSPFLTRIDVYYGSKTGIVDYSIFIKTNEDGFTVQCSQMGLSDELYPFPFVQTIEGLVKEAAEDFGLQGLARGEHYEIYQPNI